MISGMTREPDCPALFPDGARVDAAPGNSGGKPIQAAHSLAPESPVYAPRQMPFVLGVPSLGKPSLTARWGLLPTVFGSRVGTRTYILLGTR